MDPSTDHVVRRLQSAGCVFAEDEATELRGVAPDAAHLDELVARRCEGEPLPWLVGSVEFGGMRLAISAGVYVPRPHTEPLAERGASLLPDGGHAIDLCTGCGAIAATLRRHRPNAQIMGTDIDPSAVACAASNGVDARLGSLFEGVDADWQGAVDLVIGVLPYVPTSELALLARDVQAYEPRLALDGGDAGLDLIDRAIEAAPRWLRPGGSIVLELGGEQQRQVGSSLVRAGFGDVRDLHDEDGDLRGIEARLLPGRA
ncbi:MAG: methyltransferase [Thermoleophilia bacterium]|nr:methyltransferase [Thermoleophilia bacterium]